MAKLDRTAAYALPARPETAPDRPDARPTTTLKRLLYGMRYAGVRYAEVTAAAPWAVEAEADDASLLYFVRSGSAFLQLSDPPEAVLLEEGDLAVLPIGRRHVLGEGGDRPTALDGLLAPAGTGPRPASPLGLAGTPLGSTRLLAVSLRFEGAREQALFGLLPSLIHADAGGRARHPAVDGALELVDSELGADGLVAEVVVARLFDVLVMKALAAHLDASTDPATRWLRGLEDAHVAASLLAMHERPEAPWTVASLARAAGMSRSVFAERFQRWVGDTPLGHLRRVRIERASKAIRKGAGVAEAALAVGYRSEAAFSRAFKRWHGAAPSEWRRELEALEERWLGGPEGG